MSNTLFSHLNNAISLPLLIVWTEVLSDPTQLRVTAVFNAKLSLLAIDPLSLPLLEVVAECRLQLAFTGMLINALLDTDEA